MHVHLLPLKRGIQIYYAYGYPYIMYGAESWGNTFAIYTSPIVLQQKELSGFYLNYPRILTVHHFHH